MRRLAEVTVSEDRNQTRDDDLDDDALVVALARGDQAALGQLYDRHAGILLALGLRIIGDRAVAEDVLHDVFLEAWHRARDFDRGRGTVRAWLVTRMRSRALDRRATSQRHARLAEEMNRGAELVARPPDVSAPVDGERLRHHVQGLPPELTTVIELAYFEGLSSAQIALRLHIPAGTVKSRMARALSTLREDLGAEGGSP